jgi:DNA-binding CsgD family transcriptional regulator/tetratricopeptide (TPR) repeat protein
VDLRHAHTAIVAREIVGARFVGRVPELQRLRMALEDAVDGRPSMLLVGGDAGVGKTRLLEEFVEALDARVLRGACLPLGEQGLPFAPVVDVLRRLGADAAIPDPPPVLARLVPELASEPGVPEPQAGQADLFQAFVQLLDQLAAERTTVLVVEDLHWSDRSTRELLTFIAFSLRAQRLLVIATYRADDLPRRHPLRPLLAELLRTPRVDRVDLSPFSPPEVAEYLEVVTGSVQPPGLVDAVVERTEGNAFYIEELVAAGGLEDRQLPASLRDLLLVRTESLSPQAQRLLRIASAGGRLLDDELLAIVADTPRHVVDELLREAVSMQLLVPDERAYRFRHALLRESLHGDLLPGERTDVHAAYAAALTDAPHLAPPGAAAATAELANHLQEAGQLDSALTAWIDAGEAAEGVFAFAEARHHFEQALAIWDRVPEARHPAEVSRLEILRRAAEDAFLGGEPERACVLARDALALVDAAGEPHLAGMLNHRLARYLWDTSEHEAGLDFGRRAVALVPADPPSAERAQVLAGLGGNLMALGRYQEARRVSEEAVAVARSVGAAPAECYALQTLGTVTSAVDDVDEGLRLHREAARMASALGDVGQQWRCHWNLVADSITATRWEDALARFEEAAEALPRLGQEHRLVSLAPIVAACLFRVGRWEEAERLIEEASLRRRPGERVGLPELDIARGAFAKARVFLEVQREDRRVMQREAEAWPLINLAELAAWEGLHADGRSLIDECLHRTGDIEQPMAPALACAVGLRIEADRAAHARRRRRAGELEEARRVGSRLLDRAREFLDRPGPADGWKREVRALTAQCEAEGSRLRDAPDPSAWDSAIGAWEIVGMPYAAAYCRWRRAEASMASGGSRQDARASLVPAHATALELGAEPLLSAILRLGRRARIGLEPLPAARRDPAVLSPRERDVLDLVAAGRSNRQIAAELYISEKTVGAHVSSILRKLDVSSRGEATAAAHRLGLVETGS